MLFYRLAPIIFTVSTMLRKKSGQSCPLPQTICTDGAKFSLKGIIPRQKRGYRRITDKINIKYRGYGHQTFENVAEVYYNGEKVGIMELHPRSLMSPDTVLFSVDNRLQYSDGWTTKIKEVWHGLNLSFTHICKLDLAVDQPYTNQFDFVKKLTAGKLLFVGKTLFTVDYEGRGDDLAPKARYFRFGSRSSDKFMRCYYKRQELAHSNKWYIQEFWKRNNFELEEGQEVARFEMCLKRKELKKYKDVFEEFGELKTSTLELLENPQYLAALYNTAKDGFFEFVSKRSFLRTGNITRCARLCVLDLSQITTYLLTKIKSKATTAIWSAKIAVKMLYHICCKTNEPRYMAEIEEILKNFNLVRWFEANRERLYKEFTLKFESPNFEYLKMYTSTPSFIQGKIWKVHEFTM